MSRYCLRGQWIYLKPTSRIRYESDSEEEKEVNPRSISKKVESTVNKDVKPKSIPAKPRVRKNLNL